MLISELITNLEKIKESEGDIEVVTVGEYKDAHRIEFYALSIGYDDCQEFKTSKEECEDDDPNKVLGILL